MTGANGCSRKDALKFPETRSEMAWVSPQPGQGIPRAVFTGHFHTWMFITKNNPYAITKRVTILALLRLSISLVNIKRCNFVKSG